MEQLITSPEVRGNLGVQIATENPVVLCDAKANGTRNWARKPSV